MNIKQVNEKQLRLNFLNEMFKMYARSLHANRLLKQITFDWNPYA